MLCNFDGMKHLTRTKLVFEINEPFNHLFADLDALKNDSLKFSNTLYDLQQLLSNNATTVLIDQEKCVSVKNAVNLIKQVSNVCKINFSSILKCKELKLFVNDIYNLKFEFKAQEIIKLYYKQSYGQYLPLKSFFIKNNFDLADILNEIHPDTYVYIANATQKFLVNKIDQNNGVIELVCLKNGEIKINDQIYFVDLNFKYQVYQTPYAKNLLQDVYHYDIKNILLSNNITKEYVNETKNFLAMNNLSNVLVLGNIDNLHNLNHLEEIIVNADGIVLDRYALSFFVNSYEIPYYVQSAIKMCRLFNKTFILKGNLDNQIKTYKNGKINDLYNLVNLGIDALWLDYNYASLSELVNSVIEHNKINNVAENYFDYASFITEHYFDYSVCANSSNQELVKKIILNTLPTTNSFVKKSTYDFIFLSSNDFNLVQSLIKLYPCATLVWMHNEPHFVNYGTYMYALQTIYINTPILLKDDALIHATKKYLSNFKNSSFDKTKFDALIINPDGKIYFLINK